jgi:hypothetical protein
MPADMPNEEPTDAPINDAPNNKSTNNPNLESQFDISTKIPGLFNVIYRVAIALVVIAALILFAPLPPLIIALIVLGAAALLALIGTAAFHAFTCAIKAHYAANAAGAAATYGFPTYAALKASWPWLVRLAAC